MVAKSLIRNVRALYKAVAVFSIAMAGAFAATPSSSPALEKQFEALVQAMPPLQEYFGDENEEALRRKVNREAAYAEITREKLANKWFAALITHDESEPLAIHGRFETWRGLLEFLQRKDAIVEIWALAPAGAHKYRRIPAAELDELRRANREQPHFLTVTYRNENDRVVTRRIEFGFQSAQIIWEAHLGYARHRHLILAAHEILNARDEKGQFNANAQWVALTNAVASGEFDLAHMPPAPQKNDPPFVAVEYEIDANGNYARPLRVFHEDQLALKIEGDGVEARQVVVIRDGSAPGRKAEALRTRGVSDELEPARNSLLGQDEVVLRITNPSESDPRKWAALEFGAPALFKRAALAKMARMNSQMERRRKEIAFKKTNLDLIVEPIIAGLNVGGGLSGVGFPLGEAARIPYNLYAFRLIPKVPTVAEMREIFALLAAKEKDPELNSKPYEFLTKEDVDKLRAQGRLLSDDEVQQYLATMSDSDIKAMIRLAHMGMIDARITNFLNLLTSVFKVSGVSEEAGLLRDIFNNIRFAPNGDINLKTLLALAVGKRIWTPLSGISLENLGKGNGPAEAWAQFFEVSVDLRAVVNSAVRWFKPTLAKKELEKPFPYATRLGDLAAYEFRAFGFPLLLFYKRGLIKQDLHAYENDYAYGVIGTRIVVHFPTKQDMEREILAGRLFPLGLVKVPDGKGKWRETNLAVFAYRIPDGRNKGKIALIIYGLNAYYDYSELMDRELERFERFEKALREGAVIERVVDAEDRRSVPTQAFEPKISLGTEAQEKTFGPLLAALLEQQRVERYQALGLKTTDEERQAVQAMREKLARDGVQLEERDSLVDVDKYNSAFIYRRVRDGKWESVKMTAFASLDQITRELAKADETREVAEMRRKVAAGEGEGLVTLNSVRDVNGVIEMGPPLPAEQLPDWASKGIANGGTAVNRIFQLLDDLSALEKARLAHNHYAATAVDLDLRGTGQKQKVFLTIEFPPGRIARTTTNVTSGKIERTVFDNGRPVEIATTREVVEFSYSPSGAELETRTYWNSGTVDALRKGPLIESTRTVEVWRRDLNQPAFDPYAPLISKLKFNHLTGATSLETYSLFNLPVQTVDERFITTQRFDEKGHFVEAVTVENGKSTEDFARPLSEKLAKPISGATRFRSKPKTGRATTTTQSGVVREDVVQGISRMVILDDLHSGRPIQENYTDEHAFEIHYTYNDEWWFGTIPEKVVVQSESGKILREIRYIEFNPDSGLLKGIETDYRGSVSTQVWDRRWTAPIETETELRKTTVTYDARGLNGKGRTIDKQSGEAVRDFTVTWNVTEKSWQSVDQWWLAPGARLRMETNWLSGFGRLIRSEASGVFRTVPSYDEDGCETERRTFRVGATNTLQRVEDDFRWDGGRRDARVRVWVDGEVYDDSRSLTDSEGREIASGIKTVGGIQLKTTITYDRGTERRLEAISLQDSSLRKTETFTGPRETNGVWVVSSKVTPAWGMVATNFYELGDPFGRAKISILEDGSQVRTAQWFDGTAIPKTSERMDRHGQVKQRWQTRLRTGSDGALNYDLATAFEVSPWGDAGHAQTRALLSGTDILLFKDSGGERIYFDTTKAFESPLYAKKLSGGAGVMIPLRGTNVAQVTKLYRASTNAADWHLTVAQIDLLGFFNKSFSRQTFDRAGNLLQVEMGTLSRNGRPEIEPNALFAALSNSIPSQQSVYQYDFTSWTPGADAETGVQVWTLSKSPVVLNQGSYETPTRVDAFDFSVGTNRQARSTSAPRLLQKNPWLPQLTNSWTEWKTTEGIEPGGAPFETSVIYDAQGAPVVTRTKKFTTDGKPAEKISFELPRPQQEQWREIDLANMPPPVNLPLNFTGANGAYFIYFFLKAGQARPELLITDGKGNEIAVTTTAMGGQKGAAFFWPAESGFALWSPDEQNPREGVALSCPTLAGSAENLWAVPVAALREAGLDAASIRKISLRFTRSTPPRIQFTAPELVMRVAHNGEFKPKLSNQFQEITYSSGLRSVFAKSPGGGWRAALLWNGNGVLNGYQREALQAPRMTLTDSSDPQSPVPLYTLHAEEGSFLESYQMFKSPGQTRVYSAVSGIESPRLEIFRADRIADELRPSLLVYGRDVPVAIAPSIGGGALDGLRMRLEASAWKQVGDRALGLLDESEGARRQLLQLNKSATNEFRHAAETPLLAEAIVQFRDLPWRGTVSTQAVERISTNALSLRLQQSALAHATGLISTSPGGGAEEFVDTVAEAELLQLAISVGSGSLASGVLDFYWGHSNGGTEPIFDWYDASTGASVFKSPNFKRPIDAHRTARAQLAIAEAAFRQAAAFGDTNAYRLGRNLINTLLSEFRPLESGGVTEEISAPQKRAFGLPLLPAARRFSLATNARLYILLRRLNEWLATTLFTQFDSDFRVTAQNAARDQEVWLRANFANQFQGAVVPRGIFELQDAASGGGVFASERFTATEDWLAFIEASDLLGTAKSTNRLSLENLARAHGAYVGNVWGLDWTVPWRRPEAISSAFTAKFYTLARQLDYPEAAAFAREQLRHMTTARGDFAGALTSARPDAPLLTGAGPVIYPSATSFRWPSDFTPYNALLPGQWLTNIAGAVSMRAAPQGSRDISAFFWTAASIYLAILVMTFFWWSIHTWRKRRHPLQIESLVAPTVMQLAEERWAKRVLGVLIPANADRTRFSNAAVEGNFHMQLRAIHKIVLEWRRLENEWAENDPRLVEDGGDPWLNGIDEFAAMVSIYSRFVVKAGKKDGLPKADPFEENEDSNHIWSRLVLYFSEYLWGLLQLLKQFKDNPQAARIFGINDQIEAVLRTMGARPRPQGFDARVLFDFPARPEAMDLLAVQLPGATLNSVAELMEQRLRIPRSQFRSFLKNYKTFKYREQVYPVHPYIIEASKLFPHFILMGLISVIWYNQDVNGLRIYPYLRELVVSIFGSVQSLWWGAPLVLGAAFSTAAGYIHSYRYTGTIRSRKKKRMLLDTEIGSLLKAQQSALPSIRPGWQWDPVWYERTGWALRGIGMIGLAIFLMSANAPSLATFTLVKGIFVPFLLAEAAAILLPLLVSFFSQWLEDRVSSGRDKSALARFINQLNLTPTRPASILWLGIKYHFQSSVPTGGVWATVKSIVFYFLFTATFFFIGSYSFKEVLRVWFAQRFHQAWDWELAIGSVIFWNTMYLLRFGLFVFLVGAGSFAATFPLQALALAAAALYLILYSFAPNLVPNNPGHVVVAILLLAIVLVGRWRERFPRLAIWEKWTRRNQKREDAGIQDLRDGTGRSLAVVYMSGDDLSALKLTPELLLNRLQILRDKLGSEGVGVLMDSIGASDEAALIAGWGRLAALEKKQNVSLWHPMQLVIPGETPQLEESLGLNLLAESAEDRDALLKAWHVRRWLVTMMSTAGHAQDTAITLVDIALRLTEEGLSKSIAFYLIQNKYDNNDNNRPSQVNYGQGELAQRNKLAHLLMRLAPGSRAYNINDWTPFGFKAGGLVGMDFIHEESLHLSNMLVLDRNANTSDLTALMGDLKGALADPGVIIVVPGRSTTNALTPLGQASQLVEEGHRAMIKGLMAIGGGAGEAVGTGWGNIQAVYYGRVQKALLDPESPKMPLTSRMRQGSSFHEKSHGIIGFGPHAVGISEDIWGVTQASHNAIALGQTVKFRGSKAFWHKIRETWSHAEWFSAFPRWSGGYLQMMLDPIMQKINDGGPLSVFAKEIRANCGRFFLSAPFALLNILLMPLAILWDVSPFVQVLVALWLFGLVMNQVLTMLGAIAYLEATGFARLPAIVGAASLGALCQLRPNWKPLTPAAILIGGVAGGFIVGLGKWLFNRGRDLIVFGPQLVIHALGQVARQSLEFILSGAAVDDAKGVNIAFRGWAGPREDRPWERYANFINMRTVIWGVGLFSLILNIFALSKLDFLNALLLLPSLFFSISTLIGPFLMAPKPGDHATLPSTLAKIGGWLAGCLYFIVIARLLTQSGWLFWLGLGAVAVTLVAVGRAGLRYFGYSGRLRRAEEKLSRLLEQSGVAAADARKIAQQNVRVFQGDSAKLQAALATPNLDPAARDHAIAFNDNTLKPLIKKPFLDIHGPKAATTRWIVEWKRSFGLSLFTLIWFLFVPVPGLLVFSGLGYRFSMPLPALMKFVFALIALTLASYAISRLLEKFTLSTRIHPRLKNIQARFHSLLAKKGNLSDGQISTLYGLITDTVTFADQRAYAYATDRMDEAERILRNAERKI